MSGHPPMMKAIAIFLKSLRPMKPEPLRSNMLNTTVRAHAVSHMPAASGAGAVEVQRVVREPRTLQALLPSAGVEHEGALHELLAAGRHPSIRGGVRPACATLATRGPHLVAQRLAAIGVQHLKQSV